ncbi:hypothetical protein J6590_076359 [Homalodisca vitripennis]|nr:hypothetical protein J6590_076359 [Homalodisca vitripennis]
MTTVCRIMTCCMVHKALTLGVPGYLTHRLQYRDEVSLRSTRHGGWSVWADQRSAAWYGRSGGEWRCKLTRAVYRGHVCLVQVDGVFGQISVVRRGMVGAAGSGGVNKREQFIEGTFVSSRWMECGWSVWADQRSAAWYGRAGGVAVTNAAVYRGHVCLVQVDGVFGQISVVRRGGWSVWADQRSAAWYGRSGGEWRCKLTRAVYRGHVCLVQVDGVFGQISVVRRGGWSVWADQRSAAWYGRSGGEWRCKQTRAVYRGHVCLVQVDGVFGQISVVRWYGRSGGEWRCKLTRAVYRGHVCLVQVDGVFGQISVVRRGMVGAAGSGGVN